MTREATSVKNDLLAALRRDAYRVCSRALRLCGRVTILHKNY